MTKRPSSLRGRLILANASLLTACLLGFSLLLYAAFSRALSRHFDERLAADSATVAHMVEETADGAWEFEGLDEFQRMFDDGYFEVHLDDRTLFARSYSLGDHALRADNWSSEASIRPFLLPDGEHGRVLYTALLPRPEQPGKLSGRRIWVSVARSTAELEATLAMLRLFLWGLGATALAAASAVCVWAMGRGLKPLTRLLNRVDLIDVRHLGDRLPVDDLPRELQAVACKLNELLSRIEASVSREREWNVAVSHELRTPLAGLRAILDVSVSRERSSLEYHEAIHDARHVVVQMNQMVDQLLLLARLDANAWEVAHEEVALRALVDSCSAPHLSKARARGLSIENRLPDDLVLTSDYAKLRLVIGNLISNAVDYCAEGAQIRIDCDFARGVVLSVCNSGPPLPEHALEHIFEPFVRLESSRFGSGEHCGIGLTLVRALCEVLGLTIGAENRADGWVAFSVRDARAKPARIAGASGKWLAQTH